AEKKLGKKPKSFESLKKSLDARDTSAIKWVYTVACCAQAVETPRVELERLPKGKIPEKPVVVVGSGPAGLFCALRLVERGIRPILIERGDCVEEREKKINRFALTGELCTESNVQFGEGGAGTFSDGKLNTQTHHPLQKEVLSTFVRFGAPAEILYLNKPHIGSDNLKKVVKNLREYLLSQGAQVHFNAKLTDFTVKEGKIERIKVSFVNEEREIEPSAVVFAVGHSARDTFELLLKKGAVMAQKEFAVGVRIEHLQKEINRAQYGEKYSCLPAADYKLVSHASGERSAFTFCMCPGGVVMPSASEEGGVVTNGMSNYARGEKNANSALIVQVKRSDFGSESPLAGVEYQREIERKAFLAGGENYRAPVQLVGDFLSEKESSSFRSVAPTYACGTAFADLRAVLPFPIASGIKNALLDMDKKLKGFACPDAVLTAAETRTSSPVRIERDEEFKSLTIKNAYPCGEGAGYAGGITSSAVDGIRVADAIFGSFNTI
ncbi:MAG: NAD(P)/FAD-dependent oxidoreductase, partial [Clostridia bacterium]|nr:NAD(P)/FAD-dependent oxidoreductase [Clostridia bacterium]